jgi:hypothetical protein
MDSKEGIDAWMRVMQSRPLPASIGLPFPGAPARTADKAAARKKQNQRKAARKAQAEPITRPRIRSTQCTLGDTASVTRAKADMAPRDSEPSRASAVHVTRSPVTVRAAARVVDHAAATASWRGAIGRASIARTSASGVAQWSSHGNVGNRSACRPARYSSSTRRTMPWWR